MEDVDQAQDAAIRATLAAYNDALNSGRASDVLPLYTEDGVFMAPYSESHVGLSAVLSAYEAVFSELTFDVTFTIHEVVILARDHAYVRTNSAGTTAHASTGTTSSEANQELFILRREKDRWRIARYSFSPTQPPSAG